MSTTTAVQTPLPTSLEIISFQVQESKDFISFHKELLQQREKSVFQNCGDILQNLVAHLYEKYPYIDNIFLQLIVEGYETPFLSETIDSFQERFDYNCRGDIEVCFDFQLKVTEPEVCIGCRELDDLDNCDNSRHVAVLNYYLEESKKDTVKYKELIEDGRKFSRLILKTRLLDGLLMTIVRQIHKDTWFGFFSPNIYLFRKEIQVENIPFHTLNFDYGRLNRIDNWWQIPSDARQD